MPHQRDTQCPTISITLCLSSSVLSLHLPHREEFISNIHLNLSLLPSISPNFSLCPSCSKSIFMWGFCFLPISKDLKYYKSWGVEHENWGFKDLAGKIHESQSTGALRDIKLHKPCSNLRTQGGGRRKIWHLSLTLSRSLEQSIPRTTPKRFWEFSAAMSQGASLEAGDKLGSQGQRGVPNLCHHLHPSSLCRNFGVREPDIVSA